MEEKRTVKPIRNDSVHNVILENRKKVSVSGVDDVESFNEDEIVLHTEDHGVLVLKGSDLHINKLNVDSGDVSITGEINSMEYIAVSLKSKGGGLLGKMFR